MNPPPRKRVRLSISEKLRLIEESESGMSTTALSEKYGVPMRTVQDIVKHKEVKKESCDSFLQKFSICRKSMYLPKYVKIDDAVFQWFSQQISIGEPVNGQIVREMALMFHEKLKCNSDFAASNGWLGRFKARHKLRFIPVQGEKLPANHDAATTFPSEFQKIIAGVHPANIYNADEGGLFWRAFPTKTFVGPEEVMANGLEKNKDRVTLLFCANATGTHALPLLMIGESKVPRCWRGLKDFTKLPVVYTNQYNARMTAIIFSDWYGTRFVTEVKTRQESDGIKGRVVLLLDKAGCHPPKEFLDEVKNGFCVEYLPSLCTSILQPMVQGVIERTKRGYRRGLLRKLLIEERDQDVTSFQKGLTLNDCAHLAAQAWGEVHPFTLARAWRKLLGDELVDAATPSATPPSSPESSILEQLQRVTPTILEAEVEEWILLDDGEPGHAIMTVDEIVESVRGVDAGEDNGEDDGEDDGEDVEDCADVHSEVNIAEEIGSGAVDELVEQTIVESVRGVDSGEDDGEDVEDCVDVHVVNIAEKVGSGAVDERVEQTPTLTVHDAISSLTTALSWLQQTSHPRSTEYRFQLATMIEDLEKL